MRPSKWAVILKRAAMINLTTLFSFVKLSSLIKYSTGSGLKGRILNNASAEAYTLCRNVCTAAQLINLLNLFTYKERASVPTK